MKYSLASIIIRIGKYRIADPVLRVKHDGVSSLDHHKHQIPDAWGNNSSRFPEKLFVTPTLASQIQEFHHSWQAIEKYVALPRILIKT